MPEAEYTEWAARRPQPRFTDWLRERSEPTWSEAVRHRFTRELAAGTLGEEVMRRYLVQDYSFLDSFVRLLASAIVKAPSLACRVPLGRFLGAITGDENTYFQRAFDALGVSEEDRTRPALRPPTEGFQALMADAVAAASYAETLAPLVVFEWLYHEWAAPLADCRPEPFYFGEWIALHANPVFAAFVGSLRGELDREGPKLPPGGQRRAAELFRRAVMLERTFFDDAYRER